jgi:Sugar (and other) transporter.
MITPVIISHLQWKAYLIFMCTNLAFIPLVYFCYPETANLTLEEIDYLYTQPGKSARKVARELRKSCASGRDPLEDGAAKPTTELHEHVLEK